MSADPERMRYFPAPGARPRPGPLHLTLRTPEELRRYALDDLDPGIAAAVRPGDVVVGGRNLGCGSSREQAVTALVQAGVGTHKSCSRRGA